MTHVKNCALNFAPLSRDFLATFELANYSRIFSLLTLMRASHPRSESISGGAPTCTLKHIDSPPGTEQIDPRAPRSSTNLCCASLELHGARAGYGRGGGVTREAAARPPPPSPPPLVRVTCEGGGMQRAESPLPADEHHAADGSSNRFSELLDMICSTTSVLGLVALVEMASNNATPSGGSGPDASTAAPAMAAIVVYLRARHGS
jgi:hypothetical protein